MPCTCTQPASDYLQRPGISIHLLSSSLPCGPLRWHLNKEISMRKMTFWSQRSIAKVMTLHNQAPKFWEISTWKSNMVRTLPLQQPAVNSCRHFIPISALGIFLFSWSLSFQLNSGFSCCRRLRFTASDPLPLGYMDERDKPSLLVSVS